MFPRVMISSLNPDWSLTIYNASSSPYTLQVMTIVAACFVPIVLLYQGWTYWVFRKRVSATVPGVLACDRGRSEPRPKAAPGGPRRQGPPGAGSRGGTGGWRRDRAPGPLPERVDRRGIRRRPRTARRARTSRRVPPRERGSSRPRRRARSRCRQGFEGRQGEAPRSGIRERARAWPGEPLVGADRRPHEQPRRGGRGARRLLRPVSPEPRARTARPTGAARLRLPARPPHGHHLRADRPSDPRSSCS